MKKLILICVFVLFAFSNVHSAVNKYGCIGLTGGTAGMLDALDITGASTPNADNLAEGDVAEVLTISGSTVNFYTYIFDASGTDAESSPNIIRPDDYATAGVWRLVVVNARGFDVPPTAFGGGYSYWLEDTDNGSNYVGWGSPVSNNNDLILLLPTSDPASGQVMAFGVPSSVTFSDNAAKDASQSTWITITEPVAWTIHDSDVDTAVADGKQFFAVPAYMNGWELVDVVASVSDLNSAASGATTVVIRRVRGATAANMTSTGVTVGFGEYTASDEVVDTSNDELATGDKIFVDIDTVCSPVHKGASVTAIFEKR